MYSVTRRIDTVKQPRGGYIKPKDFTTTALNDNRKLHEDENIFAGLVGLSVDYLTRFMLGASKEEAFKISLLGAQLINQQFEVEEKLTQITGIDNRSIYLACQVVGYDVCRRMGPAYYKPVETIEPNSNTCENIRAMVERSLVFIQEYGPIVKEGFTFEGAYTSTVSTGDGDFLTADTIWDFKVSKNLHTNKHTLQLLMYYLMGKRSIHSEFDSINRLGIFNPRRHTVSILNIESIQSDILINVANEVIGYQS